MIGELTFRDELTIFDNSFLVHNVDESQEQCKSEDEKPASR